MVESDTLRGRLLALTVEDIRNQQAGLTEDKAQAQAAQVVQDAIREVRVYHADFLRLSARQEQLLREKQSLPNSKRRAQILDRAINEFDLGRVVLVRLDTTSVHSTASDLDCELVAHLHEAALFSFYAKAAKGSGSEKESKAGLVGVVRLLRNEPLENIRDLNEATRLLTSKSPQGGNSPGAPPASAPGTAANGMRRLVLWEIFGRSRSHFTTTTMCIGPFQRRFRLVPKTCRIHGE